MANEKRVYTFGNGELEKNHVAPPSSQDEALSRYSASGEVPR